MGAPEPPGGLAVFHAGTKVNSLPRPTRAHADRPGPGISPDTMRRGGDGSIAGMGTEDGTASRHRDPGDDLAYDACPYCPFCGTHGGPNLMDDPGGGQLNWQCWDCGAGWRMKIGAKPTTQAMVSQIHRLLRREGEGAT